MNINDLDGLNRWASLLSLEEIENLPEDDVIEMVMENPEHPGQYGFMLQLPFFRSQEHLSETMYALMQRLEKIDKFKEKIKNRQTGKFKVAQFTDEEYSKIRKVVMIFLGKGITEDPPNFVIFMGGVGSGKTTTRRKEFANGYVHFDYGEILSALVKEFGEDDTNLLNYAQLTCKMILDICLEHKINIIIEIIGDNYDLVSPVITMMGEKEYKVSVKAIYCEIEEARKNHLKAIEEDPEYLSAYFTQNQTLGFFYDQLELGEMPVSE